MRLVRKVAAICAVVGVLHVPAAGATPAEDMLANVPRNVTTNPGVDNEQSGLSWNIATPGMQIGLFTTDPNYMALCTAGVFATDADGHPVMITDSHCFDHQSGPPGGPEEMLTDVSWRPVGVGTDQPLGQLVSRGYYEAFYGHYKPIDPSDPVIDHKVAGDYAIVRLADGVEYQNRIAGVYDIVGVIHPDDLEPGMSICKFGYRTQETCGTYTDEVSSSTLSIPDASSDHGDSGAPVYVKVGGNQVALLGLAKSNNSIGDGYQATEMSATPLWDILAKKHLALNGERGYLNR